MSWVAWLGGFMLGVSATLATGGALAYRKLRQFRRMFRCGGVGGGVRLTDAGTTRDP